MVARLQLAHQRGGNRRHAACRGAGGFGAFEQAHPLLEHGDGRVGIARIDEAGVLPIEARLGRLGRVVDEALGEEEGLRRFAELRTEGATVDEAGGLAPVFRVL